MNVKIFDATSGPIILGARRRRLAAVLSFSVYLQEFFFFQVDGKDGMKVV